MAASKKKAKAPAAKKPATKPAAKKPAKKRSKPSAKKPPTKRVAKSKAAPKKKVAAEKPAKKRRATTADEDDERLALDQVLARIDVAEEEPLRTRLAALDALEVHCRRLPANDQLEAWDALASAQQGCIDYAFTDADARAALLESVRGVFWRTARIELLAKLADEEAYRLVREEAVAQLVTAYFKSRASWIYGLGGFAKQGPFADDARALLLGGFEQLVVHATAHDELVNTVAFGALAFAAAHVVHPDTGRVLARAFRIASGKTDVRAHYELKLTTGPLAVAMSALDYAEAKDDIRELMAEMDDIYTGDDFVMQMRYALWMLEGDAPGALAYLHDPKNKKNLGLAAAALADLDHKAAREAIEARAATLDNPVSKETFAEALQRLGNQQGPPVPAGRMIWMFGRKSSTEQALGSESDNVFVQRAIARTKDSELGIVTEADNSALDD